MLTKVSCLSLASAISKGSPSLPSSSLAPYSCCSSVPPPGVLLLVAWSSTYHRSCTTLHLSSSYQMNLYWRRLLTCTEQWCRQYQHPWASRPSLCWSRTLWSQHWSGSPLYQELHLLQHSQLLRSPTPATGAEAAAAATAAASSSQHAPQQQHQTVFLLLNSTIGAPAGM